MELNNTEQQIKEKLNNRTIQPSNQAWDRLDAMLTVAENEKSKRKYNWLYIAASFLGFMLIGTIFLSQNEEISDIEQSVVIENKVIEESPATSIVEKASLITPTQTISESAIASKSNKTVLKTEKLKTKKEAIIYALSNNQNPKENAIINQKTEQKISLPKSNDADVDKLLAIVDKVLETENPIKKSTIKINASKLLSQVDGELELSFREKVIKTAGKNYRTVKESLASRNQEDQSY
ncbi:MAG: hypothetical protein ABWZ56_05110 [Flavobacterium sp.]